MFSGWRLLFVPSYCLGVAAFLYYIDSPVGTGVMLGFLLGYLSYYLAQMRVFLKLWPVFREALDWNKVSALLGQ